MKRLALILGALYVVVSVFFIGFQAHRPPRTENIVGSVAQANEYHATTTYVGATAGTYTITSSTNAVLGSVVITSSTPTSFTIFDADGSATTTVVTFKESTAVGTYTFDIGLLRGLRITIPSGFTGNFVTTYRP